MAAEKVVKTIHNSPVPGLFIAESADGWCFTLYPAAHINRLEEIHCKKHEIDEGKISQLEKELKTLQEEFDEYKRTHKARTVNK